MKKKVFLSLGSNIGDKRNNLEKGKQLLIENSNVNLVRTSPIYKTEPMYNKNQESYLNQVIEVRTILNPSELLGLIKVIELRMGRKISNYKNMPRPMDIDILTVDNIIMDTPGLKLPHPHLQERKFVLEPWSNIAPDYTVPKLDKTVTELLSDVKDELATTILSSEESIIA